MMIDLGRVTLLDLLPPNFKNAHTIALSKAIENQYHQLYDSAKEVIIYPRIEQLDHSVLNVLAEQFGIDGYENTFDLATKRRLVKKCLIVAMSAGTRPAIIEKMTAVFGDAELQEWFEYGGEPFYFKILTSNPGANKEMVQRFKSLIENTKRKSAKLEVVIVLSHFECYVIIGLANALQISSAFYPRYNVARLWLDGGWDLDGQYRLDGYLLGHYLDFYPSNLAIRMDLMTSTNASNGLAVASGYPVSVEASSGTEFRCGMLQEMAMANQATIAIGATVINGIGSSLVVEKDLWCLDGNESLDGLWRDGNGYRYLEAETLVYDNL